MAFAFILFRLDSDGLQLFIDLSGISVRDTVFISFMYSVTHN